MDHLEALTVEHIKEPAFDPDEALNANVNDKPHMFIWNCIVSAVLALVVGAIIDTICRKLQNGRTGVAFSLLFFGLQLMMNILFLLITAKFRKKFLPWLQLSVDGLIFSVLIFTVQRTLSENTLAIFDLGSPKGSRKIPSAGLGPITVAIG